MRLKVGLTMAVLLLVVLVGIAQSAPDQSQPPAQQPAAPTEPQPGSGTQQQPPPATPSSPPEQTPPAVNQNPTPQVEPQPDANVPVLKHRPAHKGTHKKPVNSQSGKVVVKNGGAKEGTPQLAPGSGKEQEQHKRENTNQLLATTDANLKSVAGRQLTPAQQSMMDQIRTYVAQSKAASGAGDLDRAHTLAYKAHLLSDELARK